ncbi:N-glycosidase [Ditylenchus destructor]|uniref:N-glycosidase n=1 Tax=Ditylenchus destructor TaxID=166010 RepID=A0AAD4MM57_9BILA|nr:N-glycosidase [Ditylenchus destructor]
MKRALEAKFVQNKVLADRLIKTTNYVLIEANKDDQFWAVGLPVRHASLKNPEAWKGKNMLGQLLMELRERLKQNIDANNENMEIEESPENVEKQVEPEIVQGDAEIEVNEEEQKDNESVHSDHESSDNNWSQFKRNHFFVRDQTQPLARPYGTTWRRNESSGTRGSNSQSRPYRTTYTRSRH